MREELTEKQQRFVEAFVGAAKGNASEAARLAGYRSTSAQGFARIGEENRRKPEIRRAIEEASVVIRSDAIATREERQRFLSDIMRSVDVDPKDRIKACEVLGKMQGDFVEKQEISLTSTVRTYIPSNGRDPE